jgi:hypothetical protein
MCTLNYTYAGPALLVLPLFLISLVNIFIAGPPLKTIVLDAAGSSYGASLPFMRLEVAGSKAKFSLTPHDEMTHFFVVTCYAAAAAGAAPLALEATVTGLNAAPSDPQGTYSLTQPLAKTSRAPPALPPSAAPPPPQKHPALQLLQPLLGFSQYEAVVQTTSATPGAAAPPLPAIEYRLTYVPYKFTFTQVCVRALFTLSSSAMLLAYTAAICVRSQRELGQAWVTALLVLLVALNDPLYIARVLVGGNHAMYIASVFGQILFSGGLFLFWLIYADGMSSASTDRSFCCFYLPKLVLVGTYVAVSAVMFVLHGRVPDRINMSDAYGVGGDPTQLALIVALCASVVGVGLWLSALSECERFCVTKIDNPLPLPPVTFIYRLSLGGTFAPQLAVAARPAVTGLPSSSSSSDLSELNSSRRLHSRSLPRRMPRRSHGHSSVVAAARAALHEPRTHAPAA